MSIFNPNPDKPSNKIDTTLKANYAKIEASRETEFGTIDPKNNEIIQFNLKEESKAETSNNTTNIRITESELAIRLGEYNYFKGVFNPNFPTNDVYTFCKPELSIVFQNGAYQYTRKISDPRSIRHGAGDGGYPPKISIQRVVDSVQQNQYGKNFADSLDCSCPEGYEFDLETKKCNKIETPTPTPTPPPPDFLYCCYYVNDDGNVIQPEFLQGDEKYVCLNGVYFGFSGGEKCGINECPPDCDNLFCCYYVDAEGNVIDPIFEESATGYVCKNAAMVQFIGNDCTLNECPEYCS
jgi:hypothetical protein